MTLTPAKPWLAFYGFDRLPVHKNSAKIKGQMKAQPGQPEAYLPPRDWAWQITETTIERDRWFDWEPNPSPQPGPVFDAKGRVKNAKAITRWRERIKVWKEADRSVTRTKRIAKWHKGRLLWRVAPYPGWGKDDLSLYWDVKQGSAGAIVNAQRQVGEYLSAGKLSEDAARDLIDLLSSALSGNLLE